MDVGGINAVNLSPLPIPGLGGSLFAVYHPVPGTFTVRFPSLLRLAVNKVHQSYMQGN
jgi:hypothetical protein